MPDPPPKRLAELRRQAEERLAGMIARAVPDLGPRDVDALVRELRVHQIELELQCDELQRIQAEAEESRSHFRDLYESIPLGYVTIDAAGRIFDINPAGVEFLGERPAAPTDNFNRFVEAEDLDRFTLFCRRVLKCQEAREGEFALHTSDGTRLISLFQAVPVRYGEGAGTQLRIAFKDISRRKKEEHALHLHQIELERARDMAAHRESQAVRELLTSTLRLDSIVQSAMDAIITVDDQQRVLLFNKAAETMFGCAASEAIGQSLDRFIPARYRSAHRQHVESFGRSGETSRKMGRLGTVTGLRADGTEFPVEASISHITAEGRKFFTVILRDITERQLAEEAMRQSELRLRSTLDAMLEGCQIIGFDWTYRYVNEAASRHGRRSRSDMVGKTMMEIYPGIEQSPLFGTLRHAMAERTPARLEFEFTFPDGVKKIFDLSVEPAPEGILVLAYDISDRKRAERLIRLREERYRRLIAVAPYAILVVRGGRVIFANDHALTLFGAVASDELVGQAPDDLFHRDDHEAARQSLHELLDSGQQVVVAEERIVTLGGTPIEVELSAARYTDEEGPAVLLMLRNISERKRLHEQLRRTERIAELGTLASGMAHEIGTPMNVILGRAEYLLDRVSDEVVKRGLQTIISQVERITKVINQLLAFARRKTPDRVQLALRDVIDNSLDMFQERLAKAGVKVDVETEDPCPKILADADQMIQVLINLIMNALHAMPEGGTLRFGLVRDNGTVKLTVADTGHGMPADVVKKIFDPFFTTKEFGKGTGLGLTVVKGIIEEHHGSIVVESGVNRGTIFTIHFPALTRD
jgi:PAS domain S-box-containing protein